MPRALHPWLPFVVATGVLGACAVVAAVRGPAPPASAPARPAPRNTRDTRDARDTRATLGDDHDHDQIGHRAAAHALRGLWSRHPEADGRDDAPVSFYYFHEGDIGLYRYGHVAYNTTNSYHWSADDQSLELRWNKTGLVTRVGYRVERAGGRPVLVLDGDPKAPGQPSSRYTFVPAPDAGARAPDLLDATLVPSISATHETMDRIDNRLWIDLQSYATGGLGFSLWQLRAQGIDGRGTGWHHVGDFDDWSTEQLTYRASSTAAAADAADAAATTGSVELYFPWRHERATTSWSLRRDGDARLLRLGSDPRDFGAVHDYVDAGPSFAGFGLSR